MPSPPQPLLVSLDTRDLIPLERDNGALSERLGGALAHAGAQLVLSGTIIDELVEPLRQRAPGSAVMALLNRLERLPHVWIRTVDVEAKELIRAAECFRLARKYEAVDPLVPHFVDTVLGLGARARAVFRRRALAECLWEILAEEATTPALPSARARYAPTLHSDRALIASWTPRQYSAQLRATFEAKIQRTAAMWRLPLRVPLGGLATHLWCRPSQAPALRLAFAAWHAHAFDRATGPEPGDVDDFVRFLEVPYVDIFTCDGRRRSLLDRLRTSAKYRLTACSYWHRCVVLEDFAAVLSHLESLGPAAPPP